MNTRSRKPTRVVPLAGAAALALAVTTGCLPLGGDAGGAGGSGGTGGPAPCAPAGQGQEGAGPDHPERAPLQAEATFPGGLRWAVCGADPVNGSGLLDLHSDDGGANWTVTDTDTDTGIAFAPFHAGDDIEVELLEGGHGTVRVSSEVGELLRFYITDDGGLTWVFV